MKVYQIIDWNKHFENNRSRTIDHCSFACVPNKQHGMGFCRVVSEPDGGCIYGIWGMIVGACSQQCLPRDGWLTSNGRKDGIPWTAADLSLKFRRPLAEVERAISVLLSENVGWLRVIELVPTKCRPSDAQVTPYGEEGRKEGRKEHKEDGEGAIAPAPRFKKPTFEELRLLGVKADLPDIEVQKFWNHYESNGWKVGKNAMRSLPSAVANWKIGYEERRRNPRNNGVCAKPGNQPSAGEVVRRRQEKAMAGKVDPAPPNPPQPATPVSGERAMDLLQGLREAAE